MEEIFNSTTEPAGWQVIDNDGSGLAFTFEQQINFSSGAQKIPQLGKVSILVIILVQIQMV